MKTLIAMAAALLMGSAFAQETNGTTHMFEFSSTAMESGALKFLRNKTPGNDASNNVALDITLNYAYSLPTLQNLQLGGRLNYNKLDQKATNTEDYGLSALAYWNFRDANGKLDLTNSVFAKILLGYSWNHNYGSGGSSDEVSNLEVAVGKRWTMAKWGANHLVYSPEVAWNTTNSTTNSAAGYTNGLEIRFLQFSVFF
jgi:hypothetical protein